MAPSSASDASSDGSDTNIVEDCDEWAATLVADVSRLHETEEVSIEEDDSSDLSSSPKGFWFIRPGDNDSDDGSVSWSPHQSPKATKELQVDEDLYPTVPKVSFADSLSGDFLLPPSSLVASTPSPVVEFRRPSSTGGMSKSQSFAELRSMSTASSGGASSAPPEDDCHHWKSYFSKFVDLVIARETAAAAVVP